jgi:phosphotriesterase-related protein
VSASETVETYRGPRRADELGTTLMHEHIFVRDPELELSMMLPEWDEDRAVERAVSGLTRLAELGIDTVVDLTVPGLGRDPGLVGKVAGRVPLNLVASTGWYSLSKLPLFFQFRGHERLIPGPDPLVELFVRDIEEGIGTSRVRAALLKVKTSDERITADEERVLTAAAVAAQHTGVSITTHSNPHTRNGLAQQRFLGSLGVALDRVVIGHSGDTDEIDHLVELMDAGSTIGLDRFGMEHVLDDERRCQTLLELIQRGYADRVVVSHDASFYSHVTPPSWRSANASNWRMDNIPTRVVPMLRQAGVSSAEIEQVMVKNPQRLLTRAHSERWGATP